MACIALACLWARPAHALCLLSCTCTASATPIVFAPYNPLASGNDDSTGSLTIACGGTAGLLIPYSVALSAGTSGAMANRQMASGAKRLLYNLYTTSSYTSVWGDGTGSTATVGGSFLLDALGLAPSQTLTVYGRIPGAQSGVSPGNYLDTMVVTLTYY